MEHRLQVEVLNGMEFWSMQLWFISQTSRSNLVPMITIFFLRMAFIMVDYLLGIQEVLVPIFLQD